MTGDLHFSKSCGCESCKKMRGSYGMEKETIDDLIAEAVRRRDAELLEKVEGKKKYLKNLTSGEILSMNGEYNRAIDDVIKLIKKNRYEM